MLAGLVTNVLGLCAQNVVYRTGTAIDQQAIAAAVLRESMNPLFLQPDRFVVASDAADEQRVLGFGQLRPLSGAWELASLVVEPQARGRGLGSALVRRLLARVEGEEVWLLWTERSFSSTLTRPHHRLAIHVGIAVLRAREFFGA